MTYLQLVNAVLVRMRESQVATVNENALSALVGAFVNDAKRVVEDAWQWSVLVDRFDIAAVDGTAAYSLANCARSGAIARERTRLARNLRTGNPVVFIADAGKESSLYITDDAADAVTRVADVNANFEGQPEGFAITPVIPPTASSWSKQIELYPTPDASYTIRFYVVNCQNDLTADGDVLLVPKDAVLQTAYLFSLYERGEELGERLTLTEQKATAALSDLIAFDKSLQAADPVFTVV